MGIKIYGMPISGCTQRVLAAAHEKNLDYELVIVDLRKHQQKEPSFFSLNPFGQVPVFQDGDLKLIESRAITRYIAYTYEGQGTPLIFKDNKQMAHLTVAMEIEAHQFESIAIKLAMELAYKGYMGLPCDDAIVDEYEPKFAKVLDIYEAYLSKNKYVAGDTFSLGDVHHMPALQTLSGTKIKKMFEERPHVNAWREEILARPSWQKCMAMKKDFLEQ
ncbi:unnamed protein product [Amaranthus hypochondriacus]